MSVLVEQHLEEIGIRIGRLLRGFDDPSVHLGAPEQFAREFRKVLAMPALQRVDGVKPLSYADAVREAHVSGIDPQSDSPVAVLRRGLAGPATQSTDARIELSAETIDADLARLLREPVLRLYLQAMDRRSLLTAVGNLSVQGGFTVAVAERDETPECPRCGAPLQRADGQSPFVCARCQKSVETLDILPMSAAIVGIVSFDFLRALVGLDVVTTYQESGDIRPVDWFQSE